jgi:hypothetical protein
MKNFKLSILFYLVYTLNAQEISTEIAMHYPIMRDLVIQDMKQMKKDIYRVAVVYFDDSDSKENADNIYQLLKGDLSIISETSGAEIEIYKIEYLSKSKFYVETSNQKINFIYVSQEFDEEDITRIAFVADKNKILSFTAVEEYFEKGISSCVISINSILNLQFNDKQLIKERPDYFEKIKNIAVKE